MRNNNSCFVGVHVRKCEARKGLPCLEHGVTFMGLMLFVSYLLLSPAQFTALTELIS